MTPGAAVLMVGRDHISHHSDMHYLLLCQYSAIERDCDAAFLCHCGILFYDRAVDMQTWALLASQCRVSDTQVNVNA